jgi:photosystem II stability/assembly factor-like uncharacterized protein
MLYIAAGNGVHKSTDGGATWKVTTGWNITEVLSVSPDPRDPNRVYIATPYGVFRSTDGCATWKDCSRGLNSRFVSQVLASPLNNKEVYCVTEDGAYVSSDGAERWIRMASVGISAPLHSIPAIPRFSRRNREPRNLHVDQWRTVVTRREAGGTI